MSLTAAQIKTIIAEKLPAGLVLPRHTEDRHFYEFAPTKQVFGSVTAKANVLDTPRLKKWAAKVAVEFLDTHWKEITPENKGQWLDRAINAHVALFMEAGVTGNQGHGVIDEYLKTWIAGNKLPDIRTLIKGDPATDSRLIPVFATCRSAELFAKDFEVEPIASEMKIVSLKYGFGGTLDSLAMVTRIEQDSVWPERCPPTVDKDQHFWGEDIHNPNRLICGRCVMMKIKEFCIVDWKTSNTIDKVEYAMQTAAYRRALWEMTGLRPRHIIIVKLDKRYARYEAMRVVLPAESFRMFMHSAKLYDWLDNGQEKMSPLVPKKLITL